MKFYGFPSKFIVWLVSLIWAVPPRRLADGFSCHRQRGGCYSFRL